MTHVARSYPGSCHCGAIGFTYRTNREPSSWTVRACQCSFCRAHHVRTTSDPEGSIELAISKSDHLSRYRFGERTADFLVCAQCGVYIGAVIETASGSYGIINLNALRPIPPELPEPVAMEYGAESKEQRIERRTQVWTPVAPHPDLPASGARGFII